MRKKHKKNKPQNNIDYSKNYSETIGCGNPENDCGGNCQCSDIENTETDDGRKIFSIDFGDKISKEEITNLVDKWKEDNTVNNKPYMDDLHFFNNKLEKYLEVPSIYYANVINNKLSTIDKKKYVTLIGSFLLGYGTSCLVKTLKSY